MAILKAFRGFRPGKELAARIASRPYDVLNSEEARIEVEGNPYSFLHVVKPEVDLPRTILRPHESGNVTIICQRSGYARIE